MWERICILIYISKQETMYKSVLLTLLLCIVFTTKSGRSEIYNVNRRKIADDHQSLQIFGKYWCRLIFEIEKHRFLQTYCMVLKNVNYNFQIVKDGLLCYLLGTKEKLRLAPENFKDVCVKPEKQILERKWRLEECDLQGSMEIVVGRWRSIFMAGKPKIL